MSDYICYFAQSVSKNSSNLGSEDSLENQGKKDQKSKNNSSNFNNSVNNSLSSKSKSRSSSQVYGLNIESRRRHIYAVGKTGMGKSTMLQNIVLQDIFAGNGVCLIDPHGDSVEYILDRIPKHRHKDVIYLSPGDLDFPIGLNVLENENGEPDFLIAAGLMSVFKRIWVGSWSSRMEYILNNTLLALLEINSQIRNLEKYQLNKENEKSKSLENKTQNINHKEKTHNWDNGLEGLEKDLGNSNQNIIKLTELEVKNLENEFKNDTKIQNSDQNIAKIRQNLNQTWQKSHDHNSSKRQNLQLDKNNLQKDLNLPDIQNLTQNSPPDSHKSEILNFLGVQTLLGVVKMLSDPDFCNLVVSCLENPLVRNFWLQEFANFGDKYRQEAVAPILNKIGQFFSSSLTLNILGQTKSSLNFRRIMDSSQILLVNLSKGRLGDDNSNLLGSLIVNKIQLAAMTRMDLEEKNRKDWSLVVDEFQNFTTESFVTILSEARKYRLNLVLAHQYLSQLEESGNARTKNAIFGNVGSIISFQVGAVDARELILEFGESWKTSNLVNLPQNQIIVKLPQNSLAQETSKNSSDLTNSQNSQQNISTQTTMQNANQANSFQAMTLPSIFEKFGGQKNELIQFSRSKYGSPKGNVQTQINQFLAKDFKMSNQKQNFHPNSKQNPSQNSNKKPKTTQNSQSNLQTNSKAKNKNSKV